MPDGTPKLAWPLRRLPNGQFASVEQGSAQEIAQCVAVVLNVRAGSLLDSPDFGRPPVGSPVNIAALEDAVATFEPRADATIVDQGITAFTQTLDVPVGVAQ